MRFLCCTDYLGYMANKSKTLDIMDNVDSIHDYHRSPWARCLLPLFILSSSEKMEESGWHCSGCFWPSRMVVWLCCLVRDFIVDWIEGILQIGVKESKSGVLRLCLLWIFLWPFWLLYFFFIKIPWELFEHLVLHRHHRRRRYYRGYRRR